MKSLFWFLLFVAAISSICSAPQEDKIANLPGVNFVLHFNQYSGFLNGSTDGNIQLHYWFVESQSNPTRDPLVLWFNGGPGCSSLDGFLSEHGPLLVEPNGNTLKKNPYAWNLVANMLYIESPACVGFSYAKDGNCTVSDDEAADRNYHALLHFLSKYPELQGRDLFITGESYGGVYVPTLSLKIASHPNVWTNLKGFAVGNGLTSYDLNSDSAIYFAYFHGLFNETIFQQLLTACCTDKFPCNFIANQDEKCNTFASYVVAQYVYQPNLNMYNIDGICFPPSQYSISRQTFDIKNLISGPTTGNLFQGNVGLTPACINASDQIQYLSNPFVRIALHIPESIKPWDICADIDYHRTYMTMNEVYSKLINTYKIRGMLYNGDIDLACNFLGDQWFANDVAKSLTLLNEWHQWSVNGNIAGWRTEWNNFVFNTVRGAGHMVPSDKPAEALDMFISFLSNKYS